MLSGRHFQFRPVLTTFAVIGVAILLSLGSWQVKRLQWKLALISKVEERLGASPIAFEDAVRRADAGEDMEYTPVRLAGHIDETGAARVFGSYEAAPGHYYFTPLKEEGGRYAYVNFGFTPQSAGDVVFFEDASPLVVTGLFRSTERPSPPASWFQPVGQSSDGLWFVRAPSQFAASAGIEASSYYIDSFAIAGRKWPKGGTTRLDFSNRHLEYALTWYGLAATLIGVWLVFSLPLRDISNNFKK